MDRIRSKILNSKRRPVKEKEIKRQISTLHDRQPVVESRPYNSYVDWQPVMDVFFGTRMNQMDIIEFGKGEGTRYLASKYNSVISIEYSRYPFVCSWESVGFANHLLLQCAPIEHLSDLDDVLIRTMGVERPSELVTEAKKLYRMTDKLVGHVLLIDHGCHNRNEVLQLARLSRKWAFIVIHDINFPYYGYNLSSCDYYTSLLCHDGQGTAIFIKK